MSIEKIILAPGIVYERAKILANSGNYKGALKLLEENKLEVEIYNDHIEMKNADRDWHSGMVAKDANAGNYFKSNKNWKRGIKK